MIRASRILIIGFLLLVQLVAPLVHAHAGNAETAAILHVPGLEFLASRDEACFSGPGERSPAEFIVALSPGMRDTTEPALPSAYPDPIVLPDAPPLHREDTVGSPRYLSRDQRPGIEQVFLKTSPRAPPA